MQVLVNCTMFCWWLAFSVGGIQGSGRLVSKYVWVYGFISQSFQTWPLGETDTDFSTGKRWSSWRALGRAQGCFCPTYALGGSISSELMWDPGGRRAAAGAVPGVRSLDTCSRCTSQRVAPVPFTSGPEFTYKQESVHLQLRAPGLPGYGGCWDNFRIHFQTWNVWSCL